MYIVRLRGGLGNQLFEYAFCCYLSRFTDSVSVDDSEYKCFKCHDGLEVDSIFDIHYPSAGFGDIIRCSNSIPISVGGKPGIALFELERIRKRWSIRLHQKRTHIREDDVEEMGDMAFTQLLKNNKDKTLYFDGYWFTTQYLDRLGDDWLRFRSDFIEKHLKYTDGLDFERLCSIHVRKGDYSGTGLDVCDGAYYQRAMDHIRGIRSEVKFAVFSDEIDKARSIVGEGTDTIFMDTPKGETAGLDIWLMSLCHDNIIANSTYSYWGSRLNRHADKCVIMPAQYEKMRYGNSIVL
ncbi:MAG: alpha-1,2-fucosyltransferase [Lachnospiraceae bacterium]|nr:alpha-1,2-fucosyltransferase [Lachnospiraceae bacterium]